MNPEKINKIQSLAEVLDAVIADAKQTNKTKAIAVPTVLLKKINDLKDEISQIQIPKTDLAPIEESLNRLFNDIKSVSKDTQYTQDYFKKEISTLRNALADLKAQKPTVVDKVIEKTEVIREVPFVDAPQIATKAAEIALERTKELIKPIPPFPTSTAIIEQINDEKDTLIKREKVEGL
jgi:predicted transcriptional regulator